MYTKVNLIYYKYTQVYLVEMSKQDIAVISTKISRELAERLDVFCEEHRTNRATFLRMLIEDALEQGVISVKPSLDRAMKIRNDFINLLLDVRDTLDTLIEDAASSRGMVVE